MKVKKKFNYLDFKEELQTILVNSSFRLKSLSRFYLKIVNSLEIDGITYYDLFEHSLVDFSLVFKNLEGGIIFRLSPMVDGFLFESNSYSCKYDKGLSFDYIMTSIVHILISSYKLLDMSELVEIISKRPNNWLSANTFCDLLELKISNIVPLDKEEFLSAKSSDDLRDMIVSLVSNKNLKILKQEGYYKELSDFLEEAHEISTNNVLYFYLEGYSYYIYGSNSYFYLVSNNDCREVLELSTYKEVLHEVCKMVDTSSLLKDAFDSSTYTYIVSTLRNLFYKA